MAGWTPKASISRHARTLYRTEAIAAWTARLAAQGQPTQGIDPAQLDLRFFPTVAQTKLLLRHGARGA